jgi:hypothetical protein
MRSGRSQRTRLGNVSTRAVFVVQMLTMPVACKPDLRERTILASFTLPDRIEPSWSLFRPLLDLIPQLLPSAIPLGLLPLRIAAVEAVVDDKRQIPRHLIRPSSL